jgi:hypothetical protein
MRKPAIFATNDAASGLPARDAASRGPWWLHTACTLFVIAAVLAIACLHYRGQTLARGPDQADILLSIFYDASRAIREEGLWAAMYTPGLQAGISNWSNPHQHLLYPLYFNWLGSDASVFDTLDRLNWIIYLHLAILGAGAFQLARSLGVRLLPAIAVGLVLPWFPAMRSAAAWPQIIAGLSWLPWLLAYQVKLYTATDRCGVTIGVIGAALSATLLVYAHPAQNLVFAFFASAMIWLLIAAQLLWRRDRLAMRRFAMTSSWLALAALIVAVLAGGYLLEVTRFHEHSIRWLGEYGGAIVSGQPIPVDACRVHALAADDVGLLAAFEYRKGIGNGYLGMAVAIASFAATRASLPIGTTVVRAMLACALVAVLFCFSFMAPAISMIPIASKVRELSWWSCLAVVLLVPLAALGLQALGERATAYPRRMRNPWLWAFAAGFVLALAATVLSGTDYRVEAAIVLVIGFIALVWALLTQGSRTAQRDAACVVVLVCAVWIPFRHNIEFAHTDAMLFHPDRVQARTDAARLAALLPDEESYRTVLGAGIANAHLLTHAYANLGFRSTSGGIGPHVYDKHRLLSVPTPAVSALYGVKYRLLGDAAARPGDLGLRAGLWVRTDPAALPRLFFVGGGLRVVNDPVEALRTSRETTPAHALVAPDDVSDTLDFEAYARGMPHVILPRMSENRRTRLHATFESDRAGLLILNEDPDARWQARVDGKPVDAFRINGFQTAFAVGAAGRHEVEIVRPGRLFERLP